MRRNPTSRTSHLAMLFLFALVIAFGVVASKKVRGQSFCKDPICSTTNREDARA
jgi:hypothetical protein